MSQKDPHANLRRALAKCNLCELERLSLIPARTLRRIRNGTGGVQQATIDAVTPHLAAAPKIKPKDRAAKASATRALRRSAS